MVSNSFAAAPRALVIACSSGVNMAIENDPMRTARNTLMTTPDVARPCVTRMPP